jgi:ribosomal protein S12 methylthiotransferase accessory factor
VTGTREWGRPEVFRPFPSCPDVVFARAGARSDAFGPTDASGGAPVVVGSAAGADEADVAARARSELVERVSNILAGRAAERAGKVVAPFDHLRREGAPALDPAAWRSSVPIDDVRRVPLLWVAGRSLIDDREVLVPAGAAFLRHRPPAGCGATLRAGSAGVAAHATTPSAVRHALLEVLERDLVARSWFGAGPAHVADPLSWPGPIARAVETLGLDASTLVLPGPSGTACLVTALHRQGSEQSFGARCVVVEGDGDRRLTDGFVRAAYEALMVRWSMGTPVARRAWDFLRDRDEPSPVSALEHALWTFHRQDSLGHWLSKAAASGPPVRRSASAGELASVVASHTGEAVVAIDSTVAAVPFDAAVVRVVAPGAHRLPAEAGREGLPHPIG